MRLEHLTEVKPVRKSDLLGHGIDAVVFLQQLDRLFHSDKVEVFHGAHIKMSLELLDKPALADVIQSRQLVKIDRFPIVLLHISDGGQHLGRNGLFAVLRCFDIT